MRLARFLRVAVLIGLITLVMALMASTAEFGLLANAASPSRTFPAASVSYFTGTDNTGNFQAALEDALSQAQAAAGCCDRLITYRVVATRGQVGGFAGLNTLEVRIWARW
jgi:hypothetical protein